MGEVSLNIRSMLRKRSGRPRSATSSTGLAVTPAKATSHARRASGRLPAAPAADPSAAEAPASPPVNR